MVRRMNHQSPVVAIESRIPMLTIRFARREFSRYSAARIADVTIGAVERPDLALFGEAPSRVVVTCAPGDLEAVRELAGDLPFAVLGVVTGESLRCTMGDEELLALPVSELHGVYESLPDRLA